MKRKQIYLTEVLDKEIALLSKKEDRPKSEVIRKLLEEGLNKEPREAPGAVLLKIAAKATPGPGDLSTNLTRYLYGDKSPNYGKRIARRR
jgi:hypothetical protein